MNLLKILKNETVIEKEQRENRVFVPDFEDVENPTPPYAPKLRSNLFFKNKDVYISKHNRFAPYPEHSHEFIELNYQLNGTSEQIINGKKHVLRAGDLLLLDMGSVHSITSLGKDDILLNILFSNKMISLDWLREVSTTDSILYRILLTTNSVTEATTNFLIFRDNNETHLQKILEQMIREYVFSQPFSNQIISNYLPILLYELSRQFPIDYNLFNTSTDDPFIQVLEIIDTEFEYITLDEISNRLSYNKNYLSNLIKDKSGSTFTQLLNEKKLMKAQLLIESTEMPINMIASIVGFSNNTYFYKKYKEFFKVLPSEHRNE